MKEKERYYGMFIWSIRASTLKFFLAVSASALILCLLVVMIPMPDGVSADVSENTSGEVEYRAENKEQRIQFLQSFGWTVDSGSESENEVTLPMEFDRVFAGYNEIQRAQGMDLAPYKGKDVMSYTYTVTNYEGYSGKVLATVLVYQNTVIGGDICSEASDGFVMGFEKK